MYILHRLALILEPETCQEVSACHVLTVAISPAESNPAAGCQGLHSWVSAMWWSKACGTSLPFLPTKHGLVGCTWSLQHCNWCGHSHEMGGQDSWSQLASWLFPGASEAVGLTLVALCVCFVTWQSKSMALVVLLLSIYIAAHRFLLRRLFYYMWTPHRLALVGTLGKYTNRSVQVSGKSRSKHLSG